MKWVLPYCSLIINTVFHNYRAASIKERRLSRLEIFLSRDDRVWSNWSYENVNPVAPIWGGRNAIIVNAICICAMDLNLLILPCSTVSHVYRKWTIQYRRTEEDEGKDSVRFGFLRQYSVQFAGVDLDSMHANWWMLCEGVRVLRGQAEFRERSWEGCPHEWLTTMCIPLNAASAIVTLFVFENSLRAVCANALLQPRNANAQKKLQYEFTDNQIYCHMVL